MTRQSFFGFALACAWAWTPFAWAAQPLPPATAVTLAPPLRWPDMPIASRVELDAYRHDTPPAASPLSAFSPAGQRRFLAGLVFGQRGLGGFSFDDLTYDLTREQAWNVLRLFGAERYAAGLATRTRPRPAGARVATLDVAYDELVGASPEASGKPAAVAVYARAFAPAQARLRTLGDRDVELLLRAADRLARIDPTQTRYLLDMQRDVAELERRGRLDRPHVDALYDALLAAHRPDQARALLAAHPILDRQPPPTLHDAPIASDSASLWVARGGRDLWRQPFHLDADAQVVVLGSTGCHFSEAAARSIGADPLLRELFSKHAQWVAPAHDIVAFDALVAWNRAHPAQPLVVLHEDAGLPFVSRFATPTFYFLRQGRVVDTVVGWPGDAQRAALRAGLQKIGLLDTTPAFRESP
ncbi:hypothetical protein ACFWZ3_01055 [Frateuria sp. GZRR35]|uniref:hypothetical protein n=1 Tax=Frateuria sp. GZRR35 TaxID=3351536 RepID=UPI003EDC28C2